VADNKIDAPKKSRQPMTPNVTPIRPIGGKRLPEPYVRVEDELLPPQMEAKGLDPLRRVRGMTEKQALQAGLELPKKE
jgi:hypothetical protein